MRSPVIPETLMRTVIGAVLGPDIAARPPQDAIPKHLLAPHAERIMRLSERFTGDAAERLPRYLDESGMDDSYALYYLFINAAKVATLLTIARAAGYLTTGPLRVAELGCGPGGGLAGALAALEGTPLTLTGVDHSESALALAGRIIGATGGAFSPMRFNLESAVPDLKRPQDIIIIANTLNELWRGRDDTVEKRTRLVAGLAERHLAPGGVMLLLEPALIAPSRELIAVRDRLLASGGWRILHPCTHHAPCPLAGQPDEWCHDLLSWETPPIVRQMDDIMGFNKHRLKFSSLVLTRGEPVPPADRWYVLTDPHEAKGMTDLTVCGAPGALRMILSRRSYSEANRPFRKLGKGDRFTLKLSQMPEKKYRLSAEDVVTIG